MSPIYNKEATLRRMALDQELFREMISLLAEDGPRRMSELNSALERGDLARVHHAAHSLKGLAANFNAARAVEAAGKVEHLAKSGPSDGLPAATRELEQALGELLAELQRDALDADVSASSSQLQGNVAGG
jgi:HPt (histidine-containing phosphotransfer) domain-containing protein